MYPIRRIPQAAHGDGTRRREPAASDVNGFSDALQKRRRQRPADDEPRDAPSGRPPQAVSPLPMTVQGLVNAAAASGVSVDTHTATRGAEPPASTDAAATLMDGGLPALIEAHPHFRVISGPWAGLEVRAAYRGPQVVVQLRPKTASQERVLGKSKQLIQDQIFADTGRWVRIDIEEAAHARR
ncbi:hypothetical protein LMG32289_06164 [Cupriavidus pampae]|uniref:Flagellar hook-length control protein FliK n=1 Tax=Cupriavidus pampae TaxID=659251 RepID=A0ABN7ZLN6_9BURK|nr:hypothetical protein LMG32289_06164 [Cupriavidus pampae]